MQQQLAQETGIKQEILAKLLPAETEKPNIHRAAQNRENQQPEHPLQEGKKSGNPHQSSGQIADIHYDGPAYNDEEEHEYDVGDFIDTDAPASSNQSVTPSNHKENKQLTNMTEKALTLLVKFPESAQHIELPEDFEPEDENERLLCETLKKLKANPQKSSIGLLILWTGSPYTEYLKSIANKKLENAIDDDASHYIQGTLQNLQHRALRREWQTLQNKVASKSASTLTSEEKVRYLALPKQLKKHKK